MRHRCRCRSDWPSLGCSRSCPDPTTRAALPKIEACVEGSTSRRRTGGLVSRHVELSEDATHGEVTEAVRDLAEDGSVHGILVQLPVPAG
ncbi:MAG: hypothetical protein KTV16_03615, partial [Acidimicrobiia bacterium]|nr:hypothetical protein [Acidimicrobiia bacterium]